VDKKANAETAQNVMEAAPKKKVVRSRRKTESKTDVTKTKDKQEEVSAEKDGKSQNVVKKTRTRSTRVAPDGKEPEVGNKETDTSAVADMKAEKERTAQEVDGQMPSETHNVQNTKRPAQEQRHNVTTAKPKPIASDIVVHDFCDLANNGARIPILNDQQLQQLSFEDAVQRCSVLERIMRQVLDYDIVLSDTNIWLELQVGHTSSHSDPKVNARLQFERQLESLSKMMKRIGGKFMIMSESYEEIDRFASALEPVNYKEADWNDEVLCRNVAARLAKRLMLAQQKENRLRIEGIGSESHHGSFADPAIIRRTVELFAEGKKVLLLTNDTSVGIRSLGMCDDLQRYNKVDDKTWHEVYEPLRPMVLTMDDLKTLDVYSRQYFFLQMAAGRAWMQDVEKREAAVLETQLQLWMDGFRPGDRHERRSDRIEQQRKEQQRKEQQKQEQAQREAERKAELERREQQRRNDKERAARAKAEETRLAAAQPVPESVVPQEEPSAANTEPAVEKVAEVTAVAEEKPKAPRRGSRGRGRGNKAKTEKTS